MDVGPKRDLLGMFYVTFHRLSTLNVQVILLILFVLALILHLVSIIRCLNGFNPLYLEDKQNGYKTQLFTCCM